MQWGPSTDAKLFVHILKIHSVKLDYQALALAMGNDCTPKALMHRIAKLKSTAAEEDALLASASAAAAGTMTPAATPISTPTKRAPTPRARKVTTAAVATNTQLPGSGSSAGDGKKRIPAAKGAAGAKRVASGAVKAMSVKGGDEGGGKVGGEGRLSKKAKMEGGKGKGVKTEIEGGDGDEDGDESVEGGYA